jgi:hypothetical protein
MNPKRCTCFVNESGGLHMIADSPLAAAAYARKPCEIRDHPRFARSVLNWLTNKNSMRDFAPSSDRRSGLWTTGAADIPQAAFLVFGLKTTASFLPVLGT